MLPYFRDGTSSPFELVFSDNEGVTQVIKFDNKDMLNFFHASSQFATKAHNQMTYFRNE